MKNIFDLIEQEDIVYLENNISKYHDKDIIDEFGLSPLHRSISLNQMKIAELLVANNFNVNIKDEKGQTPLHYCAFYGMVSIARDILLKNGDININDKFGNQPLWTAVFNDYGRNERRDIIELYIKSGANVNHKNKVGKSPVDIVIDGPYNNLFDLFKVAV